MLSYRILAVLISLGLFSAPVAAVDFSLKLQCELDNHGNTRHLPKRIFVEVDETFLRARVSDEIIRDSGKERVFTDEVLVTSKKIRFSYKVVTQYSTKPITYNFSWFRASGKFSLLWRGFGSAAKITRGRGKCVIIR